MTPDREPTPPIAAIVIPAHNEAVVIERLLDQLVDDRRDLEIVVVCNGCTDDTAVVARRHRGRVQVIELSEPSKHAAIRAGDDHVSAACPRLYVDADVELSAAAARRLATAVRDGGLHAAAPERLIPRKDCPLLVRWYYDVWEELPRVRSGLFGRGVIAVSAEGNRRLRALPPMMGDDLVASDTFTDDERAVVSDATVVVWPPRTARDLHRRRVRASTGNAQADAAGLLRREESTSIRALVAVVRTRPALAPRMTVFLAFTLAARIAARRAVSAGDFRTWLRDESSRTG